MKISCPVCNKKKDSLPGKYICSACKTIFEFNPNGKIILIKRYKFDYWSFFTALFFPLAFMVLIASNNFNFNDHYIIFGCMMIFYPVLLFIRQVFHGQITTLELYYKFFTKVLHKEDSGRITAFYLTFVTNLAGVVFILYKLLV